MSRVSLGANLAAVAHTRRKRTLEKSGILRLTGYGLNCEVTLSACAVQRRRFPVGASPTRQTAPAGSNWSNYGGNEMVEAFGEACHDIRWQRECAGRNASER